MTEIAVQCHGTYDRKSSSPRQPTQGCGATDQGSRIAPCPESLYVGTARQGRGGCPRTQGTRDRGRIALPWNHMYVAAPTYTRMRCSAARAFPRPSPRRLHGFPAASRHEEIRGPGVERHPRTQGRGIGGALHSHRITSMWPRQPTQGCGAAQRGRSRVRRDCTVFQQPVGMRRFGVQG
jgi:hypothetical protein